MPGHRLTSSQRKAIARGATVRLYRGFPRPATVPAPAASACRRIDPVTGAAIGGATAAHELGALAAQEAAGMLRRVRPATGSKGSPNSGDPVRRRLDSDHVITPRTGQLRLSSQKPKRQRTDPEHERQGWRKRSRRRYGLRTARKIVVGTEVTEGLTELLVATGWLCEAEATDRAALARVINGWHAQMVRDGGM